MNKKNKVLVIGSGGREHALLKACIKSPLAESVIAAPGNGGMAEEVPCFPVDVNDPQAITDLAKQENVDFVIIGPEVPLCNGTVDKLSTEGIEAYGPNAKAAQLEGSKTFTKDFLKKYNIPTAAYENFTDSAAAIDYLNSLEKVPVIKASGLAAGKGVLIPQSKEEAEAGIRSILDDKAFGSSGDEIVIEEFLEGKEISLHVIVSGESYSLLPLSRDHKRIGENDTGLNTGGMGAFAPTDDISSEMLAQIEEKVIHPTLKGFVSEGMDYRGTLFIGLMICGNEAKVLEFNVRFGDPETQVLIPLLDQDPLELMIVCSKGEPLPKNPKVKSGSSLVVVLASKGYPESYPKGEVITVPEDLASNISVIHAGTKLNEEQKVITNGGRVLGIHAVSKDLNSALEEVYKACEQVDFNSKYYRRDIGRKLENIALQ